MYKYGHQLGEREIFTAMFYVWMWIDLITFSFMSINCWPEDLVIDWNCKNHIANCQLHEHVDIVWNWKSHTFDMLSTMTRRLGCSVKRDKGIDQIQIFWICQSQFLSKQTQMLESKSIFLTNETEY